MLMDSRVAIKIRFHFPELHFGSRYDDDLQVYIFTFKCKVDEKWSTFLVFVPLRKLLVRMVYLTRLEHFNAAHKLYNPKWSKEQNEAVFGVCANDNWHGHNYDLYVTIKGDPHPDTGFLFDVKELSKLIKIYVIDYLDHKNLNLDVPFMDGKMCSTENLAIAIWNELAAHLPDSVKLHCVKLYETQRIYVEYFG